MRIVLAQRPMRAVTIVAFRGIRTPLGGELSVGAFAILIHDLGMTDGAIDLFGDGAARPCIRWRAAGMALHARFLGVPRVPEFVLVDEQGNRLAGADHLEFRLGVATHAVAVRHALWVEHLPDLMGRVAIHAGRNHVLLFFPEFATDHLAMHRLNLGVALGASLGDVLLGDGRARIRVGQNEMRRVAAVTDSRDREAALEQSLTVDTVHVVAEDVVLGDVAREADWGTFTMATATELRHFHGGGGRAGRGGALDVVSSVAILAGGSEFVATFHCPSVEAFGVLGLLVGVAGSAVDRGEFVGVRQLLGIHAGVAVRALESRVLRSPQGGGIEGRRIARFASSRAPARIVAIDAFRRAWQLFGSRLGRQIR